MTGGMMNGGWIDIGRISEIPVQGARVVEMPGGNIAIFRTVSDSVYALADRCPHKNGPLSQGIVHGERVACPLHDWVLDLSSGMAVGPEPGCVKTYPVAVDNGVIRIQLHAIPDEKAA